jgi:hypothetical protein
MGFFEVSENVAEQLFFIPSLIVALLTICHISAWGQSETAKVKTI